MFSVDSGIANVLEQYRKGPSEALPVFTSSSNDRNITFHFAKPLLNENILLVMDNFQPSFLRPRDIMGFSAFPSQKECLYPCLAEFNVMSNPVEKKNLTKNISYYEIELQLSGDGDFSVNTSLCPFQVSINLRVIAILISLMHM